MKVFKIMSELLKLIEKNKTFECNYGVDGDYIYFLPNGYVMYRIPKNLWLIDFDKALPGKCPLDNPKKFMTDDNTEIARMTKERRVEGRDTLIKFVSEKSYAWVNEKLLKDFNLDNSSFKLYSPKSPVFIYENEEIVGCVLPVFIKEEA